MPEDDLLHVCALCSGSHAMLMFYRQPCWTPLDNGEKGRKEHLQWKVAPEISSCHQPLCDVGILCVGAHTAVTMTTVKVINAILCKFFCFLQFLYVQYVVITAYISNLLAYLTDVWLSIMINWHRHKLSHTHISNRELLSAQLHIYSIFSYKNPLTSLNWVSYASPGAVLGGGPNRG